MTQAFTWLISFGPVRRARGLSHALIAADVLRKSMYLQVDHYTQVINFVVVHLHKMADTQTAPRIDTPKWKGELLTRTSSYKSWDIGAGKCGTDSHFFIFPMVLLFLNFQPPHSKSWRLGTATFQKACSCS